MAGSSQKLVSHTGSRSPTDVADAAAGAKLADPKAAAAAGISAVPIDASDEAIMRSGNDVDDTLGILADPGDTTYGFVVGIWVSNNVANSNSAAYKTANDAVESENPDAPESAQPLPRGTVMGWGQYNRIKDKPKKKEERK